MTPRGPLICCIGAASLTVGAFCLAQKGAAGAGEIP
jgi:hypothetical protein